MQLQSSCLKLSELNKLLLSNAISFKKAGLRCLEERNININQYEMLMFPMVVNLSLSLELFLKYVLTKQGKIVKEHDLLYLFNKLNKKTKQQILSSYFIKSPFIKVQNQDHLPYEMFLNWFNNKLESHSNLFVEWRYAHETITEEWRECDYGFLIQMIDLLEELSNRITMKQ